MGKVQTEIDIPQVINYIATTVNVGSTTTLASNQNATVTNAGTEFNAILNFGIPRGKSAYEQAVSGGYQGTEQEFNEALASDITTVANNISDINTVGSDIANVNTVAGNTTNIDKVAAIDSDVTTVAGISSDVTNVASIKNAIVAVNANESEINTVYDNLANVNTVAGNITNVNTVSGVSSDVTTVAGISTAVSAVNANKTNIDTVAGISSDVTTVAYSSSAVSTVSSNISDVNTAATNISAIIASPTQASNAAASATNAQKWAEGEDADVSPLGGTHSAKGWAETAASTLSGKQDTLVSGTNIKTVNNNSLLGSGNINIDSLPSQTGNNGKFLTTNGSAASWATIPDTLSADGTSIENNSNVLTTVGVKEQNASAVIKKWVGTKAQYDAIVTKDSNTEYTTTDEIEGQPIVIDNTLSSSSENPVQNKVVKTALDAKQATISDLSTIRSGAALGATSVQPTNLATTSYVGVVKVDGTTITAAADGTISATSSGVPWGAITGTLSNQTDLQNALDAKQASLSTAQLNAANSGATSAKVTGYDSHVADSDIHVTSSQKTAWTAKQDAISDINTIRSNASAGATAVQPGDLATVATTGAYSDLSGTPILATVATSGSYNDLSNKPTIPTVDQSYSASSTNAQSGVAVASAISGKQDTLTAGPGITISNNTISAIGRNIGEIVPSILPLTDAGLHLLDGALISGSGSYSAFVTYIAGLVTNYPGLFETEANWQTSVTNYGVCGKFVYDSTNNTVRLPKITGVMEGTTDATALGDLVEAGLPNITGEMQAGVRGFAAVPTMTGAFGSKTAGSVYYSNDAFSTTNTTYDFDASRSSSLYKNNFNKVQPQTIKCYYYIVIATTTKTEIEVDIDQVATDLNGKADVDLTNVNNSGSSRSAGWAMPSSTYTSLTVGASGTSYTAPSTGFVFVNATCSIGGYCCVYSNRLETISQSYNNTTITNWVPVKKGESFQLNYSGATIKSFIFVYAEGSKSEAN